MDLESLAAELYGLPPEQFVPARNAREKESKAAGNKELAAQIHRLGKPNQVAWLANQLARRHTEHLRPLVELGAELRAAAGDLGADQLRDFSRQQRQLVGVLLGQARQVAGSEGKRVSDDTARGLQETLHAALADPEAAELLLAGRLTDGMQHVGFGPAVGGSAGGQGPSAAKPSPVASGQVAPKGAQDGRRRRLERADKDLEQAMAVAQDAVEMRDDARVELDGADAAAVAADLLATRLRDELDAAVAEQSRTARDQRRIRATFERADKAAQDAVRRLEHAEAARQRIARQDGAGKG